MSSHFAFYIFCLFLFCSSVNTTPSKYNDVYVDNDDRTKIIIDCDAGGDDAFAILLALSKLSQIEVVAITTVTGNTGVENVTKNVLQTLKVVDKTEEIPVYKGSPQGLVFFTPSDNFFGLDGFGDNNFPNPPTLSLLKECHSALAIVKYVKKHPGEITLVCLGPLTNVAIALHIYPKLFEDVKQVVILGGSYQGGGNVKPGVEFNMYADPEAAAFVFQKALPEKPFKLVPLEAVVDVGIPMKWRTSVLGRINSPQITFLNKVERRILTNKIYYPYDQSAMAIVIKPEIAKESILRKVSVETMGNFSRGALFIDAKSTEKSVEIITQLDQNELKELFIKLLK